MQNLVSKFTPAVEAPANDEGLVSIEYVVLGGLVVAALTTAFVVFGPKLQTAFDNLI